MNMAQTNQEAAEHEDYCAMIERFRKWCDDQGLTFHTAMREAVAARMGEPPTLPVVSEHIKRRGGRPTTARLMELTAFGADRQKRIA
jgi:hypothetical protein